MELASRKLYNVSHLGKRKLIFKIDFSGDIWGYVSSQEGILYIAPINGRK